MDINEVMIWSGVIVTAGTYIVTGASILLKFVAPRTKNTVDDEVYKWSVKILQWLSFADKNLQQVKIKIRR